MFGDANANGQADPGEAVSGLKLNLTYQFGSASYTATTSSNGRFTLSVPTAPYFVTGSGGGWNVIPEIVTNPAGGTDVTLRAVRLLTNHELSATIKFTKHTYAPGDNSAHIVITLTNNGSMPLLQRHPSVVQPDR